MHIVLACLVFIISYIFIINEKVNRALVACTGGVLMILTGIVSVDHLFVKYIDWHTIALLFSMMIIVSITSKTGIFEFIAVTLAQKVSGRPIPLMILISLLTGLGSAFLDNVTTVLLFVPIIIKLTRELDVPSHPYLVAAILFANIGGTATLIGDPPNIMIGQAVAGVTFNDFIKHLTPIVLVIFVLILIGIIMFYRPILKVSEINRLNLLKIDPNVYLKKGPVLFRSVTVLLVTISGFLLHPFLHVDITTIAMAGALLLLLLTTEYLTLDSVFDGVDWTTLFFFIGLFMLVGGLAETGLIDEIAKSIIYYTDGDIPTTALLILWGAGILSGFVDNIPFVAAMIPVIKGFQEFGVTNLHPLWWALSLGSCLGGNGTLIGASANVIVAGLANQSNEPITFRYYMKIGLPVVFVSLVVATIYLYFRYLVHYF